MSVGCVDPDSNSKPPQIQLSKHNKQVFRKHIIIKAEQSEHGINVILTPGSRLGPVFVNGEYLEQGRQARLDQGFVIHLAYETVLIYHAPGEYIPRETVRRLTLACQPDREHFEQTKAMLAERQSHRKALENQQNRSGSQSTLGVNTHSSISPKKPDVSDLLRSKLPALLTFHKENEDIFLNAVFSEAEQASVNFRLAPAYVLYLAIRHVHTATVGLTEAHFQAFCVKITEKLQQTIESNIASAGDLAFWMANSSELLNFVRFDADVCPRFTVQNVLAQIVQMSFRFLVGCQTKELQHLMNAFFADTDEDMPSEDPEYEADLNVDKETGKFCYFICQNGGFQNGIFLYSVVALRVDILVVPIFVGDVFDVVFCCRTHAIRVTI